MKNTFPVLKLFKTKDSFYVYDTYHNCILKITEEQYRVINRLTTQGIAYFENKEKFTTEERQIQLLLNKLFFSQPWIKSVKYSIPFSYIRMYLNSMVHHLILQVTQECNFMCQYCMFSNNNEIDRVHSPSKMSWNVAKQAIDFLWRHSGDAREVTISFYGGEPLLNYELIKQCVYYAERVFLVKRVRFGLTTNGSLITDEMASFFEEHSFWISISLDGDKSIHNMHRKHRSTGQGTFDQVMTSVRILQKRRSYFETYVSFLPVYLPWENSMNVISFFQSLGISDTKVHPREADLSGIDISFFPFLNKQTDQTLNENKDSSKLADYEKIIQTHHIIPQVYQHDGPCIPGVQKLFVSTQGEFRICEKVIDGISGRIGDLSAGFDYEAIEKNINMGKITEEQCKQCWCMRFCNVCVAKCIDPETGIMNSESITKICNLIKKQTLAFLRKYVEKTNHC